MGQTNHRKKLIEVALPLEAINAASAREKSIRHGHPSTLHLWWARRPLAACRAVLFGQLVDDPSAWPERFPTEEEQENERMRLFKLLGGTKEAGYKDGLVAWESSTDERMLNSGRYEIARSVAWNLGEEPPTEPTAVLEYIQEKAPPVYDPFCGGGSIPLEAQRLGLRAYGSDLNPVAVLISKALVEIPPKFAGQTPVNPDAHDELQRSGHWNGKGAQGLAEDVRYYGQWMRDEAEKRIGHLYPRAEVTEEAVRQQPSLKPLLGQKLTVIAWLWARTVASPDPAARGAKVPLASSFMLSTKKGKKAWVEPVRDADAPDGYRFETRSGEIGKAEEAEKKSGTKAGRGANFTCVLTGTPIAGNHIKHEGSEGRIGARLIAIVAHGPKGRVYLPPEQEHEVVAASAEPEWAPEGELPDNPRWFSPPDYGMPGYKDLFTRRQLVALTTFSDLVGEAREKVLQDARSAGLPEGSALTDGGAEAQAYADAVATYLAIGVDRASDFWNANATWESGGGFIAHLFTRQAIPMVWDFSEANPYSTSSGNWSDTAIGWIEKVLKALVPAGPGWIKNIDAADGVALAENALISTDPPYYDNIGYSDLSDFFYVWARRSLRQVWPNVFRTMLVPKKGELVASPYRHGNRETAEKFFRDGMGRALGNLIRVSADDSPTAIYYAFKQAEVEAEGVASTGWASFLQSVLEAGFIVDATLPVRTERAARSIGIGTNALASSIVLVCRKRPVEAKVTTRADFLKVLRRELPQALKLLQQGSIAPVDMAQASIGPGMAVFSRYEKVLEADDSPMSVKTALQLINAELDSFLSEQEAEFDAWTRFAVTWFETHTMQRASYGEAETLATARGVSVSGVEQAGIVESGGGRVRLIPRDELPSDWDPGDDDRPTVWESTQHLIRRLDEGGEDAAADLLARLGSLAEPARDLAYRLFGICERKGWAEEGRAYNGLVIVWPDLARKAAETRSEGPSQGQLEL
ncbi:DUF1156 domain-containing protein [Aquisalimonas asiatica]|uniref:Putative DNA methylase n=1 Tax=Aquisalimonas asiatica TaxID=406100 RepID=A0A1H8T3Q8_9GAMM|nr:DUF1156 domain-containing protein [Aquisalimonas asiatica]SEO85336.1 putative DNA methylase [Aquisalimonas asiatica]